MYDTIQLFNQEIKVKNHYCSANPDNFPRSELKLHLYIKLTDACQAHCKFCSNSGMEDFGNLDFTKLKYVLTYLQQQNRLSGISITGGEPLLNINKLNDLLNLIMETTGKVNLSISTNGYHLKNILTLDNLYNIDAIHISRHHYKDEVNDEIFGIKTASYEDYEDVLGKLKKDKLIVLNCLLMKQYINSLEEVKKYLDFAGKLGIYKAGFVSLMKINAFSQENFINFNEIFNNLDTSFLKTNHFYDQKICECCDGIYLSKDGTLTEYYARMTKELDCQYARQLVYTSDNRLTMGFGKKPLI